PDLTIVADVGIGHEKSTVAHFGQATAVLGADIHRHALADLTVDADDKPGRSAAILDRLRRRPKRSVRVDHGARANRGVAAHMNMGDQTAARLDPYMRSAHATKPK